MSKMNDNHVQFLIDVLLNLNDATVNWDEVAKARGIGRKDNAATQFRNMMKKYGIEYAKNRFAPIGGFDRTSMGPITPSKQGKTETPRKRKFDENRPKAQETISSPSKKHKAAARAEIHEAEDELDGGRQSD